jgi:hypothetical protein
VGPTDQQPPSSRSRRNAGATLVALFEPHELPWLYDPLRKSYV